MSSSNQTSSSYLSAKRNKQSWISVPHIRLVLANMLIIVLLSVASGFFLYIDFINRVKNAEQQTLNAAARYHDNAWLILSSIDSILHATAERLQDNPDPQILHDFIEHTVESLSFLRTLIVVLPNGEVIGDSRPEQPAIGVNIADRQYIKNHVDGTVDGIDIDFPVQSRVDGAWSIPVSLASRDSDGNLQWIIVVAFDPQYFAGLFIPEEIDQVDYGVIINERGNVLGSIPFDETLLNIDLHTTEFFTDYLPSGDNGLYHGQSLVHDKRSIIAFRTTELYPLYVVTQIDFSTIYVELYRDATIIILVTLGLIVITTAITRYQIAQMNFMEQQAVTLKNSEERFHTLLSVAPIGIALLDDKKIVDVNKHFSHILGYSFNEIVGQESDYLDSTPNLQQVLHVIFENTGYLYNKEFQVKHRNGHSTPILASARRIQLADKALMLLAFSDISDRLEAEKAKQMTEALRAQLQQEQELQEFKTHLVSMIAHDLRTPISVILSSAGILSHYSDRLTSEQQIEHLVKIQNQVVTLNSMIDEISGIKEENTTLSKPEPEIVQLVPMIQTIVDNLSSATHNKCIINFTHRGQDNCCLDRGMFQKIIANLLTNAIKYSHDGGEVELSTHCHSTELELTVRDHGIGIPAQDQARLFDMFFRASNVGKTFGTGIGLAIVKQTVDQLGGTIYFESEENVGTSFTVMLPNQSEELKVSSQAD